MRTLIEEQIELEDLIEEKAKERFPTADPKWFSKRHMDTMHDNARKSAKVFMSMRPELQRHALEERKANG
jgi:hypothetical protein